MATVADDSQELAPKVVNIQSTSEQAPPAPAPRRRRKEERGLPSDAALLDLAKTYLTCQGKLWPKCVDGDLIPATKANIRQLAQEFRARFVERRLDKFEQAQPGVFWESLAAIYLRYSDDGSNPRSIDQQLIGALEHAKKNGIFVPSEYLFFDAAITATTPIRNGYRLAKKAVEAFKDIRFLIVDELSRANRYNLESLRIGDLMNRLDKHILGVADGFDSRHPMSKLTLALFGALNEWFIDQLSSKVKRGRKDAFRRGTNLGLPAVGYLLVPAFDSAGHGLLGADGIPVQALAVNAEWKDWVNKAFELYGEQMWSRDRIARLFNENQVGGSRCWNSSGIKQLLTRYKYVGIDLDNTTYKFFDGERFITKRRARKEWRVRRARHLQIVSWQLWKKVQARLAASKKIYVESRSESSSRVDLHPKALFRPRCGCCGFPLIFGRSGKYASFTCVNGPSGAHGCTFKGYKSVQIVENSILEFLKGRILTDQCFDRLVDSANDFLTRTAETPKEDIKPIEMDIRDIKRKRDNLYQLVENGEMPKGARKRIHALERELQEKRRSLSEITQRMAPPPAPIRAEDAKRHLASLRSMLQLDIGRASTVLRELTGPITIRQVNEANQTKPAWIADFTLDLVPVALRLAKESRCPTADTWEYLRIRGWTMPLPCSVTVQKPYAYRQHAEKVVELRAKGLSKELIASELGVTYDTVERAIYYSKTGIAPGSKRNHRRRTKSTVRRKKKTEFKPIAAEVIRLKDIELVPFKEIAKRMKLNENTVRRAHKFGRRAAGQDNVIDGRRAPSGRYSHIGYEKVCQIRRLLADGETVPTIAKAVGVSNNTVYRERARLREEKEAR